MSNTEKVARLLADPYRRGGEDTLVWSNEMGPHDVRPAWQFEIGRAEAICKTLGVPL